MATEMDIELVGDKEVGIRLSEKSDIFFIIELPSSAKSKIIKPLYNIETAREFVSIYNQKLKDKTKT